MSARLAVGDRVTVDVAPSDPIEISVHRHAIITAVDESHDGTRYVVGHPPAPRRFGPYAAAQLIPGWVSR